MLRNASFLLYVYCSSFASGDFCQLQTVGPDLDLNRLKL